MSVRLDINIFVTGYNPKKPKIIKTEIPQIM